jgi:hypothetical protein
MHTSYIRTDLYLPLSTPLGSYLQGNLTVGTLQSRAKGAKIYSFATLDSRKNEVRVTYLQGSDGGNCAKDTFKVPCTSDADCTSIPHWKNPCKVPFPERTGSPQKQCQRNAFTDNILGRSKLHLITTPNKKAWSALIATCGIEDQGVLCPLDGTLIEVHRPSAVDLEGRIGDSKYMCLIP